MTWKLVPYIGFEFGDADVIVPIVVWIQYAVDEVQEEAHLLEDGSEIYVDGYVKSDGDGNVSVGAKGIFIAEIGK